MRAVKIFGLQLRALNSLLLVFVAIPVAVSSIFLYIAPYEVAWRKTWSNIHIFLGFVLIASAILHVAMNWRALRAYLRRKLHEVIEPRAEGAVAFAAAIILLCGVIAYPAAIKGLVGLGWVAPDSRLVTASATDASCSRCPYLYSYGGCHSGVSFKFADKTYYGYDTVPSLDDTTGSTGYYY